MAGKQSARILIADDHRLLAEACKKMLEPEFEVIGIVTDGRALVRAALELRPDVAIIDVSLPHLNGLDAAEQIKRNKLTSVKLLFLTVNSDPEVAAEAFRRGAAGYVLKHSGAEEFIAAIRQVVSGKSYLSPLMARETMTYLLKPPNHRATKRQITAREAEILQLLAEGRLIKQIAEVLEITPGTVAFHKYRMMAKLGAATNADLLRYAIRHHLVSA